MHTEFTVIVTTAPITTEQWNDEIAQILAELPFRHPQILAVDVLDN